MEFNHKQPSFRISVSVSAVEFWYIRINNFRCLLAVTSRCRWVQFWLYRVIQQYQYRTKISRMIF